MVVKVSSNKKQEKEEVEEEEEIPAPAPEAPKVEKRSSYSWMKGVGLGSRTVEQPPPPPPPPKKPSKKAAKPAGAAKPRQRLDASVEKEVDRIIDSQDNEYVLSKPKYALLLPFRQACLCFKHPLSLVHQRIHGMRGGPSTLAVMPVVSTGVMTASRGPSFPSHCVVCHSWGL